MVKCSSYHTETGAPRCWGTREKDECSCGGDRARCDFYPEVREKERPDGESYYEVLAEQLSTLATTKRLNMTCRQGFRNAAAAINELWDENRELRLKLGMKRHNEAAQ